MALCTEIVSDLVEFLRAVFYNMQMAKINLYLINSLYCLFQSHVNQLLIASPFHVIIKIRTRTELESEHNPEPEPFGPNSELEFGFAACLVLRVLACAERVL